MRAGLATRLPPVDESFCAQAWGDVICLALANLSELVFWPLQRSFSFESGEVCGEDLMCIQRSCPGGAVEQEGVGETD